MGGRTKDMLGFRTGSLVVVAAAQPYVNPSGGTSAQWLCRCDCGAEVVKRGSALSSGKAKSCGCARSTSNRGRGLVDLTGERFGRWTVIERAESGPGRTTRWSCVCDCGTRRDVAAASLRKGQSTSCGCGKSERARVVRDLTGQPFGRWTVLDLVVESELSRERSWKCRCQCGTERDVVEASLVRGVSTSCGCLCVENAAISARARIRDLTGCRYGMLLVLENAGLVSYPGGAKTSLWLCRCDCGVEKVVAMPTLVEGGTQSCGCATGSRMEAHVRRFCLEHALAFTPQRSFPDLRGSAGRPLAFDFEAMTPAGTVLIECQGEQHFRPVEWFGGQEKFEQQQINDEAKRAWAAQAGVELVEVHYDVATYEQMAAELSRRLGRHWYERGLRAPWEGDDAAV